jgi:hypothetical protein
VILSPARWSVDHSDRYVPVQGDNGLSEGRKGPVGSESAALKVWLHLVAGLLTDRRVIRSWPDANK